MGEHTFDHYKLLVEEVREARRSRRDASIQFLTLNAAGLLGLNTLAGGLGAVQLGALSLHTNGAPSDLRVLVGYTLMLILTCWLWRTTNKYYTMLLYAKYRIIYEIEDELEHQPIRHEYQAMGSRKSSRSFTLEYALPVLFTLAYVVFLAHLISLQQLIELAQQGINSIQDLISRR